MKLNRDRVLLMALGAAMIALGIFLPAEGYQPLDPPPGDPPISGWLLLQIALIIEGVVLLALEALNVRYRRIAPEGRLKVGAGNALDEPTPRQIWIALAAITLLGAVLRLINLDTDLWLDEIASTLRYGSATFLEVYTTYNSTNNHLLNSWLVSLMTSLFGYQEWAIRLPAVVFGVLAIPAMFSVARLVFKPSYSLAAVLMLAVSYHHIFFSQNARGYTAYMLFGLLAAGLLVRALQEDRPRHWALFVGAALLCLSAHLTAGFVLVGQGIASLVALILIARQSGLRAAIPMLRRLIAVFAVLGGLALLLYAPAIPQALVVVDAVYTTAGSGYNPLSLEFYVELLQGFAANINPLLLIAAVPVAILGLIGALSLLRRSLILLLALGLGPVVHFAFALIGGLTFSPRFFLILLFPAILIALETFLVVGAFVARRAIGITNPLPSRLAAAIPVAGVIAVCAVFMFPLRTYYTIPKQSYTAPVEYILAEHPGTTVIALHLVEAGIRYYVDAHPVVEPMPLVEGVNLFHVRSVEELDATLASAESSGEDVVLITTLERNLGLEYPDLAARLYADYVVERVFPGSIGDGNVKVWVPAAG